jgi:hypothetical protein
MAKYIGTLTSDARGKIGGLVLTRARNGTNIKAHAVPVNPSSVAQVYIRGLLANAVNAWRQKTGTQLSSWDLFAASYTWVNSLGQSYIPTGLQLWTQAYINANRFGTAPPAAWSGTLPVLDPITSMQVTGDGTTLVFLASDSGGAYTSKWLLYCTRPLPASLNYVKSTARRYVGQNPGGNFIIATTAYLAAFGALPPAYGYVGFCATGVDPVTYISASPYVTAQQVIP